MKMVNSFFIYYFSGLDLYSQRYDMSRAKTKNELESLGIVELVRLWVVNILWVRVRTNWCYLKNTCNIIVSSFCYVIKKLTPFRDPLDWELVLSTSTFFLKTNNFGNSGSRKLCVPTRISPIIPKEQKTSTQKSFQPFVFVTWHDLTFIAVELSLFHLLKNSSI